MIRHLRDIYARRRGEELTRVGLHPYRTADRHRGPRHPCRDGHLRPDWCHRPERAAACNSDAKTYEVAVAAYRTLRRTRPTRLRQPPATAGHWRSIPARRPTTRPTSLRSRRHRPTTASTSRRHSAGRLAEVRCTSARPARRWSPTTRQGATAGCNTAEPGSPQAEQGEPKRPALWAGRFGLHHRTRGGGNT